ncbi:MAG: TolC family protein, partial [Nannocystaceae bacterium]
MCTGPLTKWSAWTLSTATILALGGCAHDTVETSRQELARTEAQLAPVAAEEEDAEDPTPATESTTAEELPSGSLAQFQAYAVAHSPALRASFERWRAAVELPQQQRALPDPTITYAGFVSAIETRVGPMRHRLGVRQWFPWPTSVTARGDAAAARAVGAQRVFEAHALSLGAEVARAYWKLWSIDQEQQIQIKQVEVLETTKRLAETLVETGAANVSVLARISLRIARHESRLEALKEARARASAKLAFTLGLEEEVGFEIRATIDEPRTLGESVEVLARVADFDAANLLAWACAGLGQAVQIAVLAHWAAFRRAGLAAGIVLGDGTASPDQL